MNSSPLEKWHQMVSDLDASRIEDLIDEHCIFYSPIVFKPQEGKRLTVMYLTAAYKMFSEANDFRYVKEIVQGHEAVLEFNAEVDGILIDGIDMITWNNTGKIIAFKVMIRPLKAIDKIKEKMFEQLSQMTTFQKLKLKGGMIWDKFKS
ncbi:MAG: nuclear transport factor 2 family protein [Reichenbachiella sp.]|uniref:nuclear transport factor 2 family protein n=1 Tax=Reichenbachiella sp. TaxID=2184521 RepID=UPI0032634A7A